MRASGRSQSYWISVSIALLICTMLPAKRLAAQVTPVGTEFQVNTSTVADQDQSAMACDADGNFVVAWDGYVDGTVYGVLFQRFDSMHNPLGTEFELSSGGCPDRENVSACRDGAGGAVVVWEERRFDGSGDGIVGQRYDSSGGEVGGRFRVNSYTLESQFDPDVACAPGGQFVVAWESRYQDGYEDGIFGQRFDSAGGAVGTEFQVNSYTNYDQAYAAVALSGTGEFVVVWASNVQDGFQYGVFGQRFDSAGARAGTEFQVNSYTYDSQNYPDLAADADGDFIVVWSGLDSGGRGVLAQRFSSAGTPAGTEFLVNTYSDNDQEYPVVAAAGGGEFVVAWQSFFQDDSRYGIFAQRFDAAGGFVGSDFQVNTYTSESQQYPSISLTMSGDFVIAWVSRYADQDGDQDGVFAQRFTSAAVRTGTEFQVNTHTLDDQRNPAVAGSATGDFLIGWDGRALHTPSETDNVFLQFYSSSGASIGSEIELQPIACLRRDDPDVCSADDGNFVLVYGVDSDVDDNVLGQRFDAAGAPTGTEFQVNTYTSDFQGEPVVACAGDGAFVVAWESERQDDGYRAGVFGQRFDSAAMKLGSEFQITTYTEGRQEFPSVDASSNGDFVVVWTSYYQDDPNYSGVFGQRFASGGAPLGTEFQVNTYTPYRQRLADVGTEADGDFVVVWMSYQDGDEDGIFAQRFASGGARVGAEFQVNTQTLYDQRAPVVTMSDAGRFVVVWHSRNQDSNGYGVFGKAFDSSGAPEGAEFQVNTYVYSDQSYADVCGSADGNNVAATWESSQQDGEYDGIFGQAFFVGPTPTETPTASETPTISPTATPILPPSGGEFQVNTSTIGYQSGQALACDANGNFVVAWDADSDVAYGIQLQRFDSMRNPLGTEFTLPTGGCQDRESIAACRDAAGAAVVVWEEESFDGSDEAIIGQRYNSSGAEVGARFQVNSYTPYAQYRPDIACTDNGEFVVAWVSGISTTRLRTDLIAASSASASTAPPARSGRSSRSTRTRATRKRIPLSR